MFNPFFQLWLLGLTSALRLSGGGKVGALSMGHKPSKAFNMINRKILAAGLWLALLVAPPSAQAGDIAHVMHSWRQTQNSVDAMLRGTAPYDQAQLRQAMAAYIADASRLAGRVNPATTDGQDLHRRFLDFASIGQQSADSVSRPDEFRTNFSEMKAQCESCHAIYN